MQPYSSVQVCTLAYLILYATLCMDYNGIHVIMVEPHAACMSYTTYCIPIAPIALRTYIHVCMYVFMSTTWGGGMVGGKCLFWNIVSLETWGPPN